MMSHSSRIGLVDCNNFYVSCEQAFNPRLRKRPVVVLSNNDGCVVSRSTEAKQAGIPMGVPHFQIRQQLYNINGVALSSNYPLYADMSSRAMRLIHEQIPQQEIYSIDECFVDLSEFAADQALVEAFRIRQRLLQCLSLPVSIGIGATKTQAKLASAMAKKPSGSSGVCDLSSPPGSGRHADMLLQSIRQVWGIGRRITERLEVNGVQTIGDLLGRPERWVRQHFGINLLRTVQELKGQPRLPFQTAPEPRKQIIASRSFGGAVYELNDLVEAVSTFVTRAGERLRTDHSLASVIEVYYRAKNLAAPDIIHSDGASIILAAATDDTRVLTGYAIEVLESIYQPGLKYKKAGIVLSGIVPANIRQPALSGVYPMTDGPSQAMRVMDRINQRYGRDTVKIASMGARDKAPWHMSCSRRSRRYTTALTELPVLSAHGMR